MPNWCSNTLTVSGKKEDVERFVQKATVKKKMYVTDLSLNQFVPMPKELNDTRSPPMKRKNESKQNFESRLALLKKQYGAVDWYDWRITNWGIKWDVMASKTQMIKGKMENVIIDFNFDSPWSPPIQWLIRTASMYPQLTFRLKYEEPLMSFEGEAVAKNRNLISDICKEK